MKLIVFLAFIFLIPCYYAQKSWSVLFEQSVNELENKNIQKAEYLAIKANEEILKTTETSENKGKVANHLGFIFHSQGKITKALEKYLEAEEYLKTAKGNASEEYATLMSSLAILYEDTENFEKVEEYYLKAISEFEVVGIDKNNYCYLLFSLGNIYKEKREFDLAVPILSSVVNMYNKEKLVVDRTYINTQLLLGTILNESNDFESAIQSLKSVFAYSENPTLVPQKKLTKLLYQMGVANHGLRQYQIAIELFETAMQLENVNISEHVQFIYLYCEGNYQLKNYIEADNKINEVITHLKKAPKKTRLLVNASLLKNKLTLELNGFKYLEKEIQSTNNLAKEVYGEQSKDYAFVLNELGLLYYKMGKYQKADLSYQVAIEILKQNHILNLDFSSVLINYSQLKLDFGELSAAEKILTDLLHSYQDSSIVNRSFVLILQTLGKLYEKQSEFDKAELLLTEAGKVQEALTGENHPDYAIYLNTMGSFYFNVGNFSKAVSLLIKSSDIIESTLGSSSIEYATSLNNIAMLYKFIEDFEEALSLQKKSLLIEEKRMGRNNVDFAVGLYNLSNIYMSLNDFATAESNLKEAMQVMMKMFGTEHPEYARVKARLGKLRLLEKKWNQAKQELSAGVQVFEKSYGRNNEEAITFKLGLAEANFRLDEFDVALDLYNSSIQSINENISRYNSYFSETEKTLYLQTLSPYFNAYYSFIIENNEEHPNLAGLLYNNLLNTKGALLRSTMALRKRVLNSNDPNIKNKYNRWIYLNKAITENQSIPEEKRYIDIEDYKEEANELEKELVQIVFKEEKNENWNAIHSSLKEDEVCIEFFSCNQAVSNTQQVKTYYALVLLKTEVYPKLIKLCTEDELSEIVDVVSGSDIWVVNKMYGTVEKPNEALHQLIWKPIEQHISNKKKVYYSPTGLLHKISFNAIHNPQAGYLIDQYQLIPLITTNTLVSKENVLIENTDKTVLFGGVNYNTESTAKEVWSYLDGTKSEIEKIQSVVGRNISSFEGELASEENFKQNTDDKAIIHLATHGFFFPNPDDIQKEIIKKTEVIEEIAFRGTEVNGATSFTKNKDPLMRSGLVLARANDLWSSNKYTYKDDGMLTASEVAQMDLRNTKLVVLSACETGLGDINGDEGVYGLQRAFKIAGVNKIIMSLWQVPDIQTKEFMILFYQNLKKIKSVESAFYTTQKEMSKGMSPYYWGAFILVE